MVIFPHLNYGKMKSLCSSSSHCSDVAFSNSLILPSCSRCHRDNSPWKNSGGEKEEEVPAMPRGGGGERD
ncbi:hypothetical protein BHE74_00042177 [Ensete ventricosum]|nr:hypothetical protein GW17_00023601 [Ensete ventricosum]RWW51463.1 hypothetical protein BHE74_00042177 [Ensete ventricosum]